MKKLFAIAAAILMLGSVAPVLAQQSVDATFAWEQPDYDEVNYWILYWGATTGGPYDVGQQQIDKTMLQPNQSANVTITYPPNAKTTYYYVLVAFKDTDVFSPNSNEVPLEVDFRIPPGQPLNLQVTIVPAQ